MIEKVYREYVMKELFVDDFFEVGNETKEYLLEERDKGGESIFHFGVNGSDTFAILNIDKKNTKLNFLRTERKLSLNKRVDHIVWEEIGENQWMVHLIEMKSDIPSVEKWIEIKGKFRASYLLVQALCSILHMKLAYVRMYTTFEHVCLEYAPENLISRRVRVGEKVPVPKMEWSGNRFELRFGDDCTLPFIHTPIQMKRNENKILEGMFQYSK